MSSRSNAALIECLTKRNRVTAAAEYQSGYSWNWLRLANAEGERNGHASDHLGCLQATAANAFCDRLPAWFSAKPYLV